MRTLDWYFDFISPYSWLQSQLLHTLPPDFEVRYKPILFAALLSHWDNRGPAEIAPKRSWTYESCAWLAHRHGIALNWPAHHPFNPLPMLRLCIALGTTPQVVHRLFRYVWQEGHLPSEVEHWDRLVVELGAQQVAPDAPEVKDALRANGEQAIAAQVFGVPTAVVDGQRFWGVEAMAMLQAYLRGDAFFSSDAYLHAADVPQGVQRQRKTAG